MTTTTQRIVRAPKTIAPKTSKRRTTDLQQLVADVLLAGETPEAFVRSAVRALVRRRLENKAVAIVLQELHGAGAPVS